MLDDIWFIAPFWMALAFLASLIFIRLGMPGRGVLTFLAGAGIDPEPLKANLRASLAHDECIDMIVVGHSGPTGRWGHLLGDTADRVSDHAHCSIFIVKD